MTRVLLVEDNDLNRDMLARRLTKKGFAVTPAADAEAGLVAAAAEPPDVVLMDMSLPGIDGLEATRRLKAAPATATVPVILLTAHALEGDRERAAAAGCAGYDTKPIDLDRLLALIQKVTAPPIDLALFRHDLRTPVNAILGYADLILDDGAELPADLRGGVTELRDFGRDLLAGIDRLRPAADTPPEQVVAQARTTLGPTAERAAKAAATLADRADASAVAEDIRTIRTAAERLTELLRGGGRHPAPPPPKAVEPAPEPTSVQPGGHVLIVDDEPVNRQLLARGLHRSGHTFVPCDNGAAALELLAQHSFDVVLLDLMMPGMSGFEVLSRIKRDPERRHIPVIIVSGLDQIDDVVQCLESGAEDFLPKPCNPVLLRARLAGCLEKKRMRDRELEYLRHVAAVTASAALLEAGQDALMPLGVVAERDDALGGLARVFARMVHEVQAREERLRQQVIQLKVEIDDERKARQVAEVTDTDYFRALRQKAGELRGRVAGAKPTTD